MVKSIFEIPIKNKEKTYEKITELRKNMLDYEYFLKQYKLITIYLSKQKGPENLNTTQELIFAGNLKRDNGVPMFFIENLKKYHLIFYKTQ